MRTDSSDSSGDEAVFGSTRGARGFVRVRDTNGGGEERALRRRVVVAPGGGGDGFVAVSQSSLEGAVGDAMRMGTSDSSGDEAVSGSTRGARGSIHVRDISGGGDERSLRPRVVVAPGGEQSLHDSYGVLLDELCERPYANLFTNFLSS
jgi:hypothetical protein